MPHIFSDLQAILFDMDGTLVDSTEAVVRSWRRWSERRGLDESKVLPICHGRPAADTIRIFAPDADPRAEYEFVLAEELREGGVVPIAGARELLASLDAAGSAWAIVTSADSRLARHRLTLADLPTPRELVTVDRILRGKPDPEGYLLAARLLGAAPAHCLVVEDTPIGVQAACSAGMQVLGVGETVPRRELKCAVAVSDLRGVRWHGRSLVVEQPR